MRQIPIRIGSPSYGIPSSGPPGGVLKNDADGMAAAQRTDALTQFHLIATPRASNGWAIAGPTLAMTAGGYQDHSYRLLLDGV